MNFQRYDLIGDIHGQHQKLVHLLHALGYEERCDAGAARTWRHPAGRKVVFLGDYIDRGPAIREVVTTVRGMVQEGDALAVMGNHEYNAICAATPDGKGGFLRPEERCRGGQLETRRQYAGREAEWEACLDWMRRLPMFLDLGGLRAVHACWDSRRIEHLSGKSLVDHDFLLRSVDRGAAEHRAVENVLKGPEMAMPDGRVFYDKERIARHSIRVRWWDLPERSRVSQLSLPEPFDVEGEAPLHQLRRVPHYGASEVPVFIGHYWLPPSSRRQPMASNVACLDYSAAFGDNPLVASRWDGEQKLVAEHFVTA